MSERKKWFVRSLFATVLVIFLSGMFLKREWYPFAPYTMYAYSWLGPIFNTRLLTRVSDRGWLQVRTVAQYDEAVLVDALKAARSQVAADEILQKLVHLCRHGSGCIATDMEGHPIEGRRIEGFKVQIERYPDVRARLAEHPESIETLADSERLKDVLP